MNASLNGKVCMVTGANSGIGKVTALELARMGATVVLVCRSRSRGEQALEEIRRETGSSAVELMVADLSSQASARELAAAFRQKYDRLHVLVNNAGAIFPRRELTVDGLESTFALNHLGYFLLTNLLLDLIRASAPARIVNVSSGAHAMGAINFADLQAERKFNSWRAYGQSKLANILFTVELARRLEGTGVTVNCLHPGLVGTQFGAGYYADSPLARAVGSLMPLFAISPEKGAETSIYLATSPEVAGVTGKYFAKKRPVKPSRAATDMALAERLWQVSAQLTDLPV
jgi:NAD(P)-dependent dehydrogenase (short-subunit alcohol dehydrogenase family)